MKGIISFILLLFFIEFVFVFISLNSNEFKTSSQTLENSLKLMDLYEKKIKIKRELQNILVSGPYSNPEKRINFVSEQLQQFEIDNEIIGDYKIDLLCGYINAESIQSLSVGFKPITLQDFSSGCKNILIFDYETDKVKVGRNDNNIEFIPIIGFTITSEDNLLYDFDYIGG